MEDIPKPAPKIINIRDNAAAATVPANMAPQDTAECEEESALVLTCKPLEVKSVREFSCLKLSLLKLSL